MDITLDRLVQTKKQILALFLRPVSMEGALPDWLAVWYTRYGRTADAQKPEPYMWGRDNLVAVTVSWPRSPGLEIYLAKWPRPTFPGFLRELFPDIPLRFVVTGRFRAAGSIGIGSDISLIGGSSGKVALWLRDPLNRQYALTCAHVLNGNPTQNPPVDIIGYQLGHLAYIVSLSCSPAVNPVSPLPTAPLRVDCALAMLVPSSSWRNSIPGQAGAVVAGFATAAGRPPTQGQAVSIVNADKQVNGTIGSTMASAQYLVSFPQQNLSCEVQFEDLISITGPRNIGGGDSGSLVISNDNLAVAMVCAVSEVGPTILACDMQQVLTSLTALVGGPLSLL